jgi:hypothetical protein
VSAAPDYVEPVSGWRTWRIDGSGPEARLASVVRPAAWAVGAALVAECPGVTFAHHPPGPGCRCGIHVARDAAEAAFHADLPSRAREPLAVGLAALWGRLVEGEAGWRGSHAYPSTLYVIQRRPADRERCGELAWDLTAYGVPVGVLDCTRRGVLEALRATAPAARRRRPVPLAAAS